MLATTIELIFLYIKSRISICLAHKGLSWYVLYTLTKLFYINFFQKDIVQVNTGWNCDQAAT